jgi:hypothetical protein
MSAKTFGPRRNSAAADTLFPLERGSHIIGIPAAQFSGGRP